MLGRYFRLRVLFDVGVLIGFTFLIWWASLLSFALRLVWVLDCLVAVGFLALGGLLWVVVLRVLVVVYVRMLWWVVGD